MSHNGHGGVDDRSSARTPLEEELTALPRPPSWTTGMVKDGRGGKGKGRDGMEKEGKSRGGKR